MLCSEVDEQPTTARASSRLLLQASFSYSNVNAADALQGVSGCLEPFFYSFSIARASCHAVLRRAAYQRCFAPETCCGASASLPSSRACLVMTCVQRGTPAGHCTTRLRQRHCVMAPPARRPHRNGARAARAATAPRPGGAAGSAAQHPSRTDAPRRCGRARQRAGLSGAPTRRALELRTRRMKMWMHALRTRGGVSWRRRCGMWCATALCGAPAWEPPSDQDQVQAPLDLEPVGHLLICCTK